jgi:hypothetical protein
MTKIANETVREKISHAIDDPDAWICICGNRRRTPDFILVTRMAIS